MITQSGPKCDVCGKYILPVDPEERVNIIGVGGRPDVTLHAHNLCREVLLQANINKDWRRLPDGPLRRHFEKQAEEKGYL